MFLLRNSDKQENPQELIAPTKKPKIIATKTFYIKSAQAPAATPPAIVEFKIFSMFNFPFVHRGVNKNTLKADATILK